MDTAPDRESRWFAQYRPAEREVAPEQSNEDSWDNRKRQPVRVMRAQERSSEDAAGRLDRVRSERYPWDLPGYFLG